MTMKTTLPLITDFLRNRAAWFVVAAWLLVILTVPVSILFRIGPGINAFYHPQHEWATYDRAVIRVLEHATVIAVFAAIGSSIAFASGWRALASATVVACWAGLLAGSAVQLHLVERGPQQFDRYVAEERFVVPWQYSPQGSDSPGRNGFSVRLCLNSLLGTYDQACRDSTQLSIYPPKLDLSFEETTWQRRQNGLKLAGSRGDYQIYLHTIPAEGNRSELTLTYYRRADPDGKLLTWVTCYSFGSCDRHTRVENHVLVYHIPESAFPEWSTMDGRLAALVNSWAVP